jgi:predicted transcriptional regulator
MSNVLKVGIATVEEQRKRTLEIVSGLRERKPDEPKLWFPSLYAAARVLSDENLALLKAIRELHPESIEELAKAVGRLQPNVSRSLHTMQPYGLVRLVKKGRVVMPETAIDHVTMEVF